jgi:hypothetical protein
MYFPSRLDGQSPSPQAKKIKKIAGRRAIILIADSATKFGLVTRDILGKYLRCMLNINAPELEYIVFDYTGYSLQREKYLESILEVIPAMDSLIIIR